MAELKEKSKSSMHGSLHIHTVLGFLVVVLLFIMVLITPQEALLHPSLFLSYIKLEFIILFLILFVLWFLFKLVYTWRTKQKTEKS